MYQKILVAIDGSPTSDLALHEALRIAKFGSHLIAITVVVDPLTGYGTPAFAYKNDEIHQACVAEAKKILKKAETDAKYLGDVPIETQLIDLGPRAMPDIVPAILKAAKDHHADLIIIGRNSRAGLKRFFLGSIAGRVIHESHIPVMVIHGEPNTSNHE